eukprot:365719-Chlamydomonas_euryale.AAC.5
MTVMTRRRDALAPDRRVPGPLGSTPKSTGPVQLSYVVTTFGCTIMRDTADSKRASRPRFCSFPSSPVPCSMSLTTTSWSHSCEARSMLNELEHNQLDTHPRRCASGGVWAMGWYEVWDVNELLWYGMV